MRINFTNASFIKSAAYLSQAVPDIGQEIAFVGRSNAGKSSALNALTGQRGLAKTSKLPGRTQLINFFSLSGDFRLVDLPGYGFAKVPKAVLARWESTLSHYLQHRQSLKALILLVDSRHPLGQHDHQLLTWAREVQLPIHILLTKSDKLGHQAKLMALKNARWAIKDYADNISIQLFSSMKSEGVEELKKYLLRVFKIIPQGGNPGDLP